MKKILCFATIFAIVLVFCACDKTKTYVNSDIDLKDQVIGLWDETHEYSDGDSTVIHWEFHNDGRYSIVYDGSSDYWWGNWEIVDSSRIKLFNERNEADYYDIIINDEKMTLTNIHDSSDQIFLAKGNYSNLRSSNNQSDNTQNEIISDETVDKIERAYSNFLNYYNKIKEEYNQELSSDTEFQSIMKKGEEIITEMENFSRDNMTEKEGEDFFQKILTVTEKINWWFATN